MEFRKRPGHSGLLSAPNLLRIYRLCCGQVTGNTGLHHQVCRCDTYLYSYLPSRKAAPNLQSVPKLYCLITVWRTCCQGLLLASNPTRGQGSNPWSFDRKHDAQTVTPPSHKTVTTGSVFIMLIETCSKRTRMQLKHRIKAVIITEKNTQKTQTHTNELNLEKLE